MFSRLKQRLYFPIAWYFRLFAAIKLHIWHPKIVVITGSSGKTTTLHLIQSQLGNIAKYSHHANSSYGIPFDILGFSRQNLTFNEWVGLFLFTPFKILSSIPKEKIYIVEVDCDRPGEGKFLSSLLNPDIVIWTNVSRTHAVNFEKSTGHSRPDRESIEMPARIATQSVVGGDPRLPTSPKATLGAVTEECGDQDNIEKAIAYEYGYFLEKAKEMVIINRDDHLISDQLNRASKVIKQLLITKNNLKDYSVSINGAEFKIDNKVYKFKYLLPENFYYSLTSCLLLCDYLRIKIDNQFRVFHMPPGRSSILKGIKNTILIDSSYNANYDSMEQILNLFNQIPSENKKWLIISDMLEQGKGEKEEHEKSGKLLLKIKAEKIIIMGPRSIKYTYPILKKELDSGRARSSLARMTNDFSLVKFETPKEVLDYLMENIQGEEMILFKGGRFLEGIIEHLLADKNDVKNLCRREKIWQMRRKKWNL